MAITAQVITRKIHKNFPFPFSVGAHTRVRPITIEKLLNDRRTHGSAITGLRFAKLACARESPAQTTGPSKSMQLFFNDHLCSSFMPDSQNSAILQFFPGPPGSVLFHALFEQ